MGWMKRRSSSEIYTTATTHGVTDKGIPSIGVGRSRKEVYWFQWRVMQTPN